MEKHLMRTLRWVLVAAVAVLVSCGGGSSPQVQVSGLTSDSLTSASSTLENTGALTVSDAGTDTPKQVQIEAWSILPRPTTERITLFQDAKLTIYGDCTGSTAITPSTDVYFVGVDRNLTVPVDMGYAIEATSSSMYQYMYQSGLNSTPISPWGSNTRVLDGVVTTTLTHEGGYRVWLSIWTDGEGRCNFRGTIQPGP